MTRSFDFRASLIGMAGIVFIANSPAENVLTASTPTAQSPSIPQGTEFKPGLDDLMTLLVQPRHNKLFLAGSAKNWELAASEARDLRRAFARITKFLPKYLDSDLDEATRSFLIPPLDTLDAAVASGDVQRFSRAFDELTGACNACHVYMEHGYLVIKVPAAPASSLYPDQQFTVTP